MNGKEINIQKLLNLAKDDTALTPPCCKDNLLDLFNSFFHLWLPQCQKSDGFLKYMTEKFTNLTKREIINLKEYLSKANKYLIDICCTFAGIYQNYGGPLKCYGQDQKYCDILIHTCLKKYSWLTEDYLYENLWQICRLCNW